MDTVPASDFVGALIAASLAAPTEQGLPAPLPCVLTPSLARASEYFRTTLGFDIVHHTSHVFAHACWGRTALLLLQTGARPGPFERAQRGVDTAPFTASTCRIATRQLHSLYRRVHSSMHRCGTPAGLEAPSWQPWHAWEFRCTDGDGNTLVFTQALPATVSTGHEVP